MLIDSHAHLNDKRLLPYLDQIISDMDKDNLSAIINVGYDLGTSKFSYDLAKKHDNIYATVGIHPHDSIKAKQSDYYSFESMSSHKKVVAIGEIGLDFYYDHSPRDVQEKVFLQQLELAHSLKLPVVLHLRDAYQQMYKLLKENKSKLEYGALLHCYSGSREMMVEFAKLDMYFSFGGAITFANATNKPEIIQNMPLDRLLLETDCPYMTPVPFRGKLNFPKYVNIVCDKVAEILGVSRESVARKTTENTKRFFNLP